MSAASLEVVVALRLALHIAHPAAYALPGAAHTLDGMLHSHIVLAWRPRAPRRRRVLLRRACRCVALNPMLLTAVKQADTARTGRKDPYAGEIHLVTDTVMCVWMMDFLFFF